MCEYKRTRTAFPYKRWRRVAGLGVDARLISQTLDCCDAKMRSQCSSSPSRCEF